MAGFRDITGEAPNDEDEAEEAETLGGMLPHFGDGLPSSFGTLGGGVRG